MRGKQCCGFRFAKQQRLASSSKILATAQPTKFIQQTTQAVAPAAPHIDPTAAATATATAATATTATTARAAAAATRAAAATAEASREGASVTTSAPTPPSRRTEPPPPRLTTGGGASSSLGRRRRSGPRGRVDAVHAEEGAKGEGRRQLRRRSAIPMGHVGRVGGENCVFTPHRQHVRDKRLGGNSQPRSGAPAQQHRRDCVGEGAHRFGGTHAREVLGIKARCVAQLRGSLGSRVSTVRVMGGDVAARGRREGEATSIPDGVVHA